MSREACARSVRRANHARPDATDELLDDAATAIEAWLARLFAANMVRTEAAAFLAYPPRRPRPLGPPPFRRRSSLGVLAERRRARRRKVWPKVRRGHWWGSA